MRERSGSHRSALPQQRESDARGPQLPGDAAAVEAPSSPLQPAAEWNTEVQHLFQALAQASKEAESHCRASQAELSNGIPTASDGSIAGMNRHVNEESEDGSDTETAPSTVKVPERTEACCYSLRHQAQSPLRQV